MLRSTFIHIPSVGRTTEAYLWQNGIRVWEDFLERGSGLHLARPKQQAIRDYIELSVEAHQSQDHNFFAGKLSQKDHWRAYPDFRRIGYLDIETTGLSPYFSEITLIGLYDGKASQFFVKGKNLSDFQESIKGYTTLVTFNGRAFDLPFIKHRFPELDFSQFHIDLRYALATLGYRGGLKAIEPQLGITRPDEIKGIDGFEAVRLWHQHQRGDKSALDKLITYNKEDIENLKPLAEFAYAGLRKKEFASARILD